jgi:Calcium/calmodulin dependent protein kinase II association domain
MTFREMVHHHLQALERSRLHARLFVTPLEIHEAEDAGVALLHLLYCEDAPGKRPRREQSHLTLVYQRRGGKWVVVQDQHSPIR